MSEQEKKNNEKNTSPNKTNNNDYMKLEENNTNNINVITNNNNNKSSHSKSKSNKSSNQNSSYVSPFSNNSKSESHSKHSRSKSKSYTSSHHSDSSHSHIYDHRGIPQVFVTKLSPRVTVKDLLREFGRFGRIRNLKLKRGYAFIEYYDKDKSKYAIKELNDKKLFGQQQRIVVEEAKDYKRERQRRRRKERKRSRSRSRSRSSRSRSRNRDYYPKRLPKKDDICFNCGKEGHWAYECETKKRNR